MSAPRGDGVIVWAGRLRVEPARLARLWDMLSEEERARAERFRFAPHRDRYVAAHGMLREALSRVVGAPPGSLRFSLGPWGKPALADGGDLEFNLAHSDDRALVAIARGRRVGVDIEVHRPMADWMLVARRFFSPAEVAALVALPDPARRRAFFDAWTRKEAFLKATGEGVSRRLDSFDVALAPQEPARLLATRPDPEEARRWTMAGLDVGDDASAAVVVEGSGVQIELRQWSGT